MLHSELRPVSTSDRLSDVEVYSRPLSDKEASMITAFEASQKVRRVRSAGDKGTSSFDKKPESIFRQRDFRIFQK